VRENSSQGRASDLLDCRLRIWKYNLRPLKAKYALSLIAALAGSVVRLQADEASPTRRAFVQLNYRSLGVTMNNGVELADKGEYEKARQYYDAAIGQDPKA
jgi:tetratricopeptide (TPR) repeat protein